MQVAAGSQGIAWPSGSGRRLGVMYPESFVVLIFDADQPDFVIPECGSKRRAGGRPAYFFFPRPCAISRWCRKCGTVFAAQSFSFGLSPPLA
jgi:hypothetical protein